MEKSLRENLESFEAQYKAGRVVLNDPKAPVEVVLSENGSEGVIHALVYRKDWVAFCQT